MPNQSRELKTSHFWRRLIALAFDYGLLFLLSGAWTWVFLRKENGTWRFADPYLFYLYAFLIIVSVLVLFLVCPIILSGATLGKYLLRIKVVAQSGPLWKALLRHESFWSISWIFLLVSGTILINHSLIIKFATNSQNKAVFDNFESFRIGVLMTFSSVVIFGQMFLFISSLFHPDRLALHDRWAKVR
ncbi:RDD family protein [Mycoplasma sp. ATU-Cv-508]|uniref:RDD family protein n=1 Tax=Mycoplasma sp. ATU-Cv-508 TaxID=2048001 RepID=UPI000FDE1480